jgi:hypothetical protein
VITRFRNKTYGLRNATCPSWWWPSLHRTSKGRYSCNAECGHRNVHHVVLDNDYDVNNNNLNRWCSRSVEVLWRLLQSLFVAITDKTAQRLGRGRVNGKNALKKCPNAPKRCKSFKSVSGSRGTTFFRGPDIVKYRRWDRAFLATLW